MFLTATTNKNNNTSKFLVGQSITLDCEIRLSLPSSSFQAFWKHNGSYMSANFTKTFSNSLHLSLNIETATWNGAGKYSCFIKETFNGFQNIDRSAFDLSRESEVLNISLEGILK